MATTRPQTKTYRATCHIHGIESLFYVSNKSCVICKRKYRNKPEKMRDKDSDLDTEDESRPKVRQDMMFEMLSFPVVDPLLSNDDIQWGCSPPPSLLLKKSVASLALPPARVVGGDKDDESLAVKRHKGSEFELFEFDMFSLPDEDPLQRAPLKNAPVPLALPPAPVPPPQLDPPKPTVLVDIARIFHLQNTLDDKYKITGFLSFAASRHLKCPGSLSLTWGVC